MKARIHTHCYFPWRKAVLLSLLVLQFCTTVIWAQLLSSNLPIVSLTKREPWQQIDSAWDGFEIIVDIGIRDNGQGERNMISDPLSFESPISIKVQGSSSVAFPKRSFRITTLDEKNSGTERSLLGFPAHEDWILKSLYQDKSLLRDDVAFWIFRQMGHYSSRSEFVELMVDGQYRGVYQLLEKVKRDPYRVNVSRLKPEDLNGDDLTGGYIISLDKFAAGRDRGWYSRFPSNATLDSANFFLFCYPKADSIAPQQAAYIRNYVDEFERVLASAAYADPKTGYRKYIEPNSFIDFLIINELSRNVDGYRASTYMHKDKESSGESRLQAGPIWDFNLAFGNASYNDGNNPVGWAFEQRPTINFIPWWWRRLMSDPTFRQELSSRYAALRQSILSEENLYRYIDRRAALLREAQQRNFSRYPILGKTVYPNPEPVPHTWEGEIAYLKWWLQARMRWMDQMLLGSSAERLQIQVPEGATGQQGTPGAGRVAAQTSPENNKDKQ